MGYVVVVLILWYGWTILILAFITILGFLFESLSMTPQNLPTTCVPKCWLPPITQAIWNDSEYRCKECGQIWRIKTDMEQPRETYRQWVVK